MSLIRKLTDATRRYMRRAAFVALPAALGTVVACSSPDEPRVEPVEPETVFLSLDITPVESAPVGSHSRANTIDSDNYFELPAYECEKLNSIRVILASKATGMVENNRVVTVDGSGRPIADNLIFRTTPGEKIIYIFGNESSLPADMVPLLDNHRPGTTVADLADLKLSRTASGALYDFSPAAYDGYSRVPMSECWEINVENASTGGLYQQAQLFITRAVTKFSFRFRLSDDFTGAPVDPITGIVINGLGSSEYLIPRNTVYSPQKYTPSTNPYQGRWITEYAVPTDANAVTPCRFTLDTPVDLRNLSDGRTSTYSPAVYFPEAATPDGGFTCQLQYGSLGLTDPVTLPNLDMLPRNTHVVVDVTVGNNFQMMLAVNVLPWNSETYEYDYTTNIGIPDDGYLTFDAGSYKNLDKPTARLVLDYPKPTRARFGISTPIGATWDAYLITTAGEEDVICFRTVDDTGTYAYSTHISGTVGNSRNIIDITSVTPPGSTTRTARLQITVTPPGGVTIPVNILSSKEYGTNEYITIIQNPQ